MAQKFEFLEKTGVDVAAGIKGGKKSRRKTRSPRSLIVNPARNNVNLDAGVNPDVDVVKFFFRSIFIYLYYIVYGKKRCHRILWKIFKKKDWFK